MATRRKRRIGYDGCGTDLVVFSILGALALWGIAHWNSMARRPLGLGRVPIPSIVRTWEHGIHRFWPNSPFGPKGRKPVDGVPTPLFPSTAPTATPSPVATPTPVATVAPSAAPSSMPPASATPSAAPTPATVIVAAAITSAKADVHASPDPLSANATALAEHGNTLYLGLPDGGIAFRDRTASSKAGTVVRPTGASGPVRAIASGTDGTIWWITGSSAANSPIRVFAYSPATKSARMVDLSPLGPGVGTPNMLAILPGTDKAQTIALFSNGGEPIFLDSVTGAQREPAAVFTPDIAAVVAKPLTSVFLSDAGAHQTLLAVSGDGVAPGLPPAISLWTSNGTANWTARQIDTASNLPAFNTLRLGEANGAGASVGGDGIALLAHASGGQTLAAAQIWTADVSGTGPANLHSVATLPDGVFGLWAPSDRITRGPSGVWWNFAGTVFHATKTDGSGATEAFLPWNGAGDEKHGHISALLADTDGVWVATDTGVHHIVPNHPDPQVGFGGYLHAALGPDSARVPSAPIPQKLNTLAAQWNGVPYKWGGNDKTGVDCSGYLYALFQGVGIPVPRATGELASTSEGKRIRDDLKFGDVLVFPGHCAMYLGNGWTTEALHPTVGKAAIWSRKSVVVKRFLK